MSLLHLVTLSIIISAYLIIGVLYAIRTPQWQVPDEPAHYNYIRQMAETGALPVMEAGDYDQKYLERLTGERFPPGLSVESVSYQDYQPPLYYVLATPVFIAFGGALAPLRLFSLALGAGVIAFAFLAVRELSPARPVLALTAAGFIAFIPQHIAMMAGVNNDSLSELVIAIGLWLILRQNRLALNAWPLAIVMGIAFITKVQAYILAPLVGMLLLIKWRQSGWDEWRRFLRIALIVFLPALLIGSLYWGRNLLVYGWPDFVGGIRHNQVVVGQPTTSGWIAEHGWADLLQRFFQFTFQSFWGQFGWMGVVMDGRVYGALLLFTLLLVVGAAAAARRWRALPGSERDGWMLLGASGLITLALYLYYNVGFVQHQGRYLFPALIPLGAGVAVSLRQWARWLASLLRRIPYVSQFTVYIETILPLIFLALLAALSLFALYRFIVPQLG